MLSPLEHANDLISSVAFERPDDRLEMLVSLTVGKVDAGVAVLLTEDKRLIEFPSILLPPDISSGSIVDITVSRNLQGETSAANSFNVLQNTIFRTFGQRGPSPPILRCRNCTQTSVVLEWDPIDLATASLRSLSLFRNGSKAGSIPKPTEQHATKISGLAVDSEYDFHLVLRTSAGTFTSERLTVRTHKMTELSGITITPGIMPAPLRESLQSSVDRIGARLVETVRIDTTHFVCTEGRGQAWERAVEMNVPVVVPDWIKGCEREGKIVGVRGYYLNADPRLRQIGQGPQQQQEPPQTQVTPPTPDKPRSAQPEAQDQDGEEASPPPPPPPPKDSPSDENPESPTTTEPEPKVANDEPKARVEDVKPASANSVHDEDDAESDSEETKEADGVVEKADGATSLPIRENGKQASDENGAEEEPENFQDVAL